jgi:hypothetical protein
VVETTMISAGDFASWLLQTAIAAGVATTAFFVLLPTKLGEKYLSFHFDRKLADLKDAQNQKIEGLKEQLSHLGDRGKRSNEKEYEALSEIWNKFCDVVQSTDRAVVQFMEHPDLNRMSNEEVKSLLDSTDLSEQQKEGVLRSDDKNKTYAQSVRWLLIAKAHNQIFELRASLKKHSIFIPLNLLEPFEAGIEICAKAEIAEFVRFRHPDSAIGHADTLAFLKQKDALLASLRDMTRARVLRELDG